MVDCALTWFCFENWNSFEKW